MTDAKQRLAVQDIFCHVTFFRAFTANSIRICALGADLACFLTASILVTRTEVPRVGAIGLAGALVVDLVSAMGHALPTNPVLFVMALFASLAAGCFAFYIGAEVILVLNRPAITVGIACL